MNLVNKKFFKYAMLESDQIKHQTMSVGEISSETEFTFEGKYSLNVSELKDADEIVKFQERALDYVKSGLSDFGHKFNGYFNFDDAITKQYSIDGDDLILSLKTTGKAEGLDELERPIETIKDSIKDLFPNIEIKSSQLDSSDEYESDSQPKLASLTSVSKLYKLKYNI